MAKIARETSQPTTSFVDERAMTFRLFSAVGELPLLSGHSSLGIAAALLKRAQKNKATLGSKYGDVTLSFDGDKYEVALPSPAGSGSVVAEAPTEEIARALHIQPEALVASGCVLGGKFLFAEVSAATLSSLAPPDVAAIRALPYLGLFVTAPGMVTRHADYVPECLAMLKTSSRIHGPQLCTKARHR